MGKLHQVNGNLVSTLPIGLLVENIPPPAKMWKGFLFGFLRGRTAYRCHDNSILSDTVLAS